MYWMWGYTLYIVLQGLVTREGLAAPFWRLAQCLGQRKWSTPQPLSWNTGWQIIMLAVPEARGVPTLKDHLSFLVTAGFTGWYFIPFEAAHSRPLFRSEFSFFRARKGLSSLVQLSGINLFYSSFKFFLMQMNNFRRSWALCYAGVGRGWLVFWTVEAADWLGEETSDSH